MNEELEGQLQEAMTQTSPDAPEVIELAQATGTETPAPAPAPVTEAPAAPEVLTETPAAPDLATDTPAAPDVAADTTEAPAVAADAPATADTAAPATDASAEGGAAPDAATTGAAPADGATAEAAPADGAPVEDAPVEDAGVVESLGELDLTSLQSFLEQGGAAIWVIAGLSVFLLALILWKFWRLSMMGAWAGARAERAVRAYVAGDTSIAKGEVAGKGGLRARVVRAALGALDDPGLSFDGAREETIRVAQKGLAEARSGLRALELIATIAPLIGLLGTVLGMIAAFQALQEAGARADPSALAGGIWEALLTTAAGMAVAIPASAALSYFESVADKVKQDMEDLATRIFTRAETRAMDTDVAQAAE